MLTPLLLDPFCSFCDEPDEETACSTLPVLAEGACTSPASIEARRGCFSRGTTDWRVITATRNEEMRTPRACAPSETTSYSKSSKRETSYSKSSKRETSYSKSSKREKAKYSKSIKRETSYSKSSKRETRYSKSNNREKAKYSKSNNREKAKYSKSSKREDLLKIQQERESEVFKIQQERDELFKIQQPKPKEREAKVGKSDFAVNVIVVICVTMRSCAYRV